MRAKASFVKPMLLLRADALPSDAKQWEYQLKLDGYRAIAILEEKILPTLRDPVRCAAPLDAPLPSLVHAVKTQGFEGLVAKRLDSHYEAGLRTGAWMKMRVNQGQEFVIGGYTIGPKSFANLPEAKSGRWGQGLTKAKMADCRWLKPTLVGQFEFLEWTGENHLRHTRFIGLRDDKRARDVRREQLRRQSTDLPEG